MQSNRKPDAERAARSRDDPDVVEATCKHVVAQRLHQAGMHWRQATAEAAVTLRAALLSTYPPDLKAHCARHIVPCPTDVALIFKRTPYARS